MYADTSALGTHSRFSGNRWAAGTEESCPSCQGAELQGLHPCQLSRDIRRSQHAPPSGLTTMQRPWEEEHETHKEKDRIQVIQESKVKRKGRERHKNNRLCLTNKKPRQGSGFFLDIIVYCMYCTQKRKRKDYMLAHKGNSSSSPWIFTVPWVCHSEERGEWTVPVTRLCMKQIELSDG